MIEHTNVAVLAAMKHRKRVEAWTPTKSCETSSSIERRISGGSWPLTKRHVKNSRPVRGRGIPRKRERETDDKMLRKTQRAIYDLQKR